MAGSATPTLINTNPLDFSWTAHPNMWIGLLTLVALEIVLGVDNIIFITILSGKLPEHLRAKARQIGIAFATISRLVLLSLISIIISLTKPWFSIIGNEISGKEFILIVGGLFLIYTAVKEIHHKLEVDEHVSAGKVITITFSQVIIQILILDLVFSIDSVITAVGMVTSVSVMYLAVIISVIFMILSATAISNFVEKHPTVKMLALAFLVMIGTMLIAEGFGQKIDKGYIYFSMAFCVFVEMLNIKLAKKKVAPVALRKDPILEMATSQKES